MSSVFIPTIPLICFHDIFIVKFKFLATWNCMESIKIEGEVRETQSVKYDLKYDMMQRNCTSTNITLQNLYCI
jgi:hypothetical protein